MKISKEELDKWKLVFVGGLMLSSPGWKLDEWAEAAA